MTRIGWLADDASYVGGAERTQAEFRAAAPDGVEIVPIAPGDIAICDRYVIHNCVTYSAKDVMRTAADENFPTFKYHNDVGSWLSEEVRGLLDRHTQPICCSPLQAEYMGLKHAHLIPPPIDLDRFTQAAESSNGNRAGAVSVGSWRNLGKAPHRVAEWAQANGGIDFYGDGIFAPKGSRPVAYEDMPALLAQYRTFVFLPMVIEPFGRTVAEAYAAGLELVINDLVGAKYWITERPEALDTAADTFWKLVLGT